MLNELLYTCLKDIDGTIYNVSAPQDIKLPYSTYKTVSNTPINCNTGQDDLEVARYQIDIYANTIAEITTISDDIYSKVLLCDTFKAIIYQKFEDKTPDGKAYHGVIDFKLTTKGA